MKKILVIQIKQLGDCILTEPVFGVLKEAFPDIEAHFLVSRPFAGIFDGNPRIDEVVAYDFKKPLASLLNVRKRKYDAVFDFLGNPRSRAVSLFSGAKIRAGFKKRGSGFFYNRQVAAPEEVEYNTDVKLRLLETVGINAHARIPKIYLTEEETKKFKKYSERTTVAVSPTSRRPARRWRKEYFAKLADALIREHKLQVVFVWGPGEEEYVRQIAGMMEEAPLIAPPTNLRELAALLKNCRMLVSNCNGTRHLAVAVGTQTLAIHGPTHWKAWKPPLALHEVIYSDVDCLFCGKQECDDMKCMDMLKPAAVEKKILEMLNSEEERVKSEE